MGKGDKSRASPKATRAKPSTEDGAAGNAVSSAAAGGAPGLFAEMAGSSSSSSGLINVPLEDVTPEDLDALVERARAGSGAGGGVDIRDRKWMLKSYASCFVGREFVTWLVEKGYAESRREAVAVGNVLLMQNYLHHVLRDHDFKDENLFYRFLADEPENAIVRAGGELTSWSTYMPGAEANQGTVAVAASLEGTLLPYLKSLDVDMTSRLRDIHLSPMDAHNTTLLDHVHPAGWVNPDPEGVFNMLVVGAGAAGLVTAVGSAGLGARVALIEKDLLGGDCLNVGCVPSKALIRSARAVKSVRQAGAYGVRVEGPVTVDFPAIMERVRATRAEVAPHDAVRRMVENYGIAVHLGEARFTGKNTVEVGGKVLKFAKCCIASGASAAIPNVPGLNHVRYLDNSTVFNLTELPSRMAVLGGGAIGCELAQSFAIFGSEVHMFIRQSSIMTREDPEAAAIVQKAMAADGVVFHFNTELSEVSQNGDRITLRYGDGQSLDVDQLLVATGRKPNVSGLNLEAAGVQYDTTNGVKVSDNLQTTNADIYAAGDICSVYKFTHAADAMARIVIRNALFFGRSKASALTIPWCTYTDPEIAHVGLYESDMERRGKKFSTYRRNYEDLDRAICDGEKEGFVKVLTREGKDKVVGATIVGLHAGDMISELTVLMTQDVGLATLAAIVHPYPTRAEAIRQLGDEFNRTKLTLTVKILFRKYFAARR